MGDCMDSPSCVFVAQTWQNYHGIIGGLRTVNGIQKVVEKACEIIVRLIDVVIGLVKDRPLRVKDRKAYLEVEVRF